MRDLRTHFNQIAPARARFVQRNRTYYRDLLRFLRYAVPPDARVVELGCGIGNVIGALPHREKTGIDFSDNMLEEARRRDRSGTRYLCDDIEHLEHSESYDVVLLLDTINSLWDVQRTLANIRVKLCHPRSRLIVTYYNFLWEPLLRLGEILGIKTPMPDQNWLSRRDVRALLDLAHFEVVTESERLLLPRAVPVLSWVANTILAKLPLLRRLCLVQIAIARPRPYERREYSVSVVIPVRNEAGNVDRALRTMPTFGTRQEIIFVEGHSTDDTWRVLEETVPRYRDRWPIRVLRQSGKGKGDAVRAGFQAAQHELLFILDGDLTVDPAELPKFYEAVAEGAGEFINGSRLVYPMEGQAMQILNMAANKAFGFLFTWLIGQPIKDTLCGTKVLLRSDYDRIAAGRLYFGDFDPFGDFDLLFGAAKLHLKILDVPVRYRARTYGTTNIQRWRHGWFLLRMCWFAARRIKFS